MPSEHQWQWPWREAQGWVVFAQVHTEPCCVPRMALGILLKFPQPSLNVMRALIWVGQHALGGGRVGQDSTEKGRITRQRKSRRCQRR